MSYFVLISVLFLGAVVNAKMSFVNIPEQYLPDILKVSVDCISKTGADADILEKIIKWNFSDNEKVRKYMYCFMKNSGYGDDKGHFVVENIVKLVGNHKSKNEFAKVIEDCNKVQGADKYETMTKLATCFHENTPIMFKL